MRRNALIGTLIAAVMVSGLWAGVSLGDPAQIRGSEQIVLTECCSKEDESKGLIFLFHVTAVDTEGSHVGSIRWNSLIGLRHWHSTIVYTLKGEGVDRGTIVATGTFRGYNGESLAITGGTGAYTDAGGTVVLTVDTKGPGEQDDTFTHTIHLEP